MKKEPYLNKHTPRKGSGRSACAAYPDGVSAARVKPPHKDYANLEPKSHASDEGIAKLIAVHRHRTKNGFETRIKF